MVIPKQRVVFILGAGCSQEDGAPLVSNFFDAAFGIERKLPFAMELQERYKFEEVKSFREKYLPDSNIEELFSFVDLQSKIDTDESVAAEALRIRKSLSYVISRTIQISLQGKSETLYSQFVKHLIDAKSVDDFTLITFNWDIMLDNALMRPTSGGYRIDYGLNFAVIEENGNAIPCDRQWTPSLYKLHGSLNWISCSCRRIFFKYREKVGIDYEGAVPFECPDAKKGGTHKIESMIIPPTFAKLDESPINEIKKVWKLAHEALVHADRIIFIGYSLPDTDLPFRLYFRNTLVENVSADPSKTKVLRLDIVNFVPYSKDKESFEERYSEIIESVNKSEEVNGRIIPRFIYKRFSEYIKQDLRNYQSTRISQEF